ncbi:hypothetical protein TruAng_008367 [Truncatella angustata]|nr:hypothetical protein TruAng_008367 [Truncatella angustata]
MEGPPEIKEETTNRKSRSRSISRTATALFRSRSSQPSQSPRRRQNSIGVQNTSQSTRPSRANSVIVGGSEPHYAQSNVAVWNTPVRPSAGSRRTSVTYDLNSYEAKRLLNLVEEPAYEKNSIASESCFQAVRPQRRASIQSPVGDKTANANIGRASSDVSLYVPMRRKSLIATPGVATRAPAPPPPVPAVPAMPRKSYARFSLPSTPARRDSLDSIAGSILSIPPLSINPDSFPRATTPCDEDYGHIGAFKIGSLRITNGSPAMSPAVETPMDMLPSLQERTERDSYFAGESDYPSNSAPTALLLTTDNERTPQKTHLLSPLVTSKQASRNMIAVPASTKFPQYLPEIQLSPVDVENYSDAHATGLLTTSKHTALEDDLFEDDQSEYCQSEVLDVRIDLNAKSLPPRPRLISEGRNSREMMRSDSGVVATPILEEIPQAQAALAKSDSGYSSNMSLRSFSARPSVSEKEEHMADTEDPPQTPLKDLLSAVHENPADTNPNGLGVAGPEAQARVPPHLSQKQLTAQDVASKDLPPSSPRGGEASRLGHVSYDSGISVQDGRNKTSSTPPETGQSLISPESSSSSQSGSSEGSGNRKPGKFGRFLNSARKPLASQASQPSDKTSIPSRPKGRFNERGGSFTLSMKRLGLMAEHSKAALEPTTNVESKRQNDEVPAVPALPKIVADAAALDVNSVSDASFWSADVSLTSNSIELVSSPTAIARKPLPIRKDSFESTLPEVRAAQGNKAYSELQHLKLGFEDVAISVAHSVPSLSEDPLTDQMKRTRSPPVSMRTRNKGSSQKRPPSRAKSTPPVSGQGPTALPLSTRSSRENMRSYPTFQPLLSRRSSRDNVHSYPPAQAVYENLDRCITSRSPAPVDTQRFTSLNSMEGEHRLPNWEVQTDHGALSQRSFVNNSRGASPVDQASHQNPVSLEPRSHLHVHKSARPMVLRHQSSYDGYSYEQVKAAAEAAADRFHEESLYQDNGPFPSMKHADGQSYVADPWSGRSMPQSLDQQGRLPPHVSRRHARTNSLGSHGVSAPYRVLHSYNSPAYKNAPIWG